ncbi:MAG: DUF1844 domain-containing protein [Planctomycetota bacterium]
MSEEDPPKIIIDSDWKEQVQKEKEIEKAGEQPDLTAPSSAADPEAVSEPGSAGEPSIPPPSFEVLLSMLFTQGLAHLGQFPDPETGEARVDKPLAKHTIGMLEVLEEKTKGNLTDDESKMMGEALHALRMGFVSVQ